MSNNDEDDKYINVNCVLKLFANPNLTTPHFTEPVHPSYQLQLDVYSFLLKVMGYDTTNKAYLAFYYPDECELHKGILNKTIFSIIILKPKLLFNKNEN